MKRSFNRIAKVVITLGSLIYIGVQFDGMSSFTNVGAWMNDHLLLVLLSLFFAIPNWSLEALKWTAITDGRFSFTKIKEVLIGHFAGLSTPFKTGDYWYRGSHQFRNDPSRLLGVLISNYATVLALLVAGAAVVFTWPFSIKWILIPAALLAIVVYFYAHRSSALTFLPWESQPIKLRLQLFAISCVRILVFSIALTVLLDTVIANRSTFEIFGAVMVIYGLSSVLPLIQLLDFTVRSGVAIWVFGDAGSPVEIFFIYFIHSVFQNFIPALFGGFWWWKSKGELYLTKS